MPTGAADRNALEDITYGGHRVLSPAAPVELSLCTYEARWVEI